MPGSETHRKGSELRRQLMGEGFVDRINQTVYDVGAPLVREALLTAKEVFAEIRAGR